MKKDDESIAEEIEVARRELLEVNAAMEEIAGSGTAHRVGASLQVCLYMCVRVSMTSIF